MADLILPEVQQHFTGAKLPLKPMHIWGMRVRLQVERRWRDVALLDIAIDSKLRGCDVVALRLSDVLAGAAVRRRAIVIQQKTGRPVQFEITDQARQSISKWLEQRHSASEDWLFPSRMNRERHLSTRQYSRLVKQWVKLIGLKPRLMQHTASDVPRCRCSTGKQAILERASCCSGIRSSRAPSVTSASSWTTPWKADIRR